MTRASNQLDSLAELLERTGEDPMRLELVQRAQRFKRSWLELAEGLHKLGKRKQYEKWGYGDLYDYCSKELHIKSSTVDKLLLSYSTVQEHAPEVLKWDGVARQIPSQDAVDYFSRAIRDEGRDEGGGGERSASHRLDAPREVIDELRRAVFDEAQPVSELRKRFNPVVFPKPEADEALDQIRKTRVAADRLLSLAQATPGVTEARLARLEAVIDALRKDLDALEGTSAPSVDKPEKPEKRGARAKETA